MDELARPLPAPAIHAEAPRDHLVEAVGLTMDFPGRWSPFRRSAGTAQRAVDGVDLQLREGEIFGLVGPNGAGKTTLIKLLTTLLRPTSGSARIAGFDVVEDEVQVRRIVGLVTSNERSFYWRLTGRQNLEFFASLYELGPRESRAWIAELFDLLDLSDKADVRFDAYSTGMKQRLAVARGLLLKPRFLFLDEPTKGVDPVASAALVQTLQERIIARWKPTMIITSHDLSEIERLCGRIAMMSAGRFLAVGTLKELRKLARTVDRYELRVRSLTEGALRAITREPGGQRVLSLEERDGALELAVEFGQSTDGFSRLVRGIVEAGGELERCTAVEESFDDVFQKLLKSGAGELSR